ncbi:MAG: DUF4428 domain-containing protein [Ruminococcaceae bacterium]|nr:DUF4428 domain-containing protein [Oscillospiraceae bacterium]
MALFGKKNCSICGAEIGLLGNKKLEDGNCCKACAKKLSPWFDERRHSTVEQIRQQLAYREQNKAELAGFRPSLTYGEMYELKAEVVNGVPSRFVVAQTSNYMEENADIIRFDQVTSFNIDIDEQQEELKYRNSEGEMVSYSPRRYEYSYDFTAELHTSHPYCDDISFRLNRNTLELQTVASGFGSSIFTTHSGFDPMQYPEYRQMKAYCDELETLFRCGITRQPMPGQVAPAYAAPGYTAAPGYAAPAPGYAAPAAAGAAAYAAAPGYAAPAAPATGYAAPAPAAPAYATTPAPAPVAAPAPATDWQCPSCGSTVSGKFCANCGTPKPAAPVACSACGWVPPQGQVPKFCPECGKPF